MLVSFLLSLVVISFLPSTNASTSGGINWMQTCQQLDAIIIPSCSSLVYSNNVLTVEGERVKGCIQNGLALA